MIIVYRLSHRIPRDERVTTHLALTARAFNADCMYYSGMHDRGLEESVKKVVEEWGGKFYIEYVAEPKKKLESLKKENVIVHLTMYGERIEEMMAKIREKVTLHKKGIVFVVGGAKVPRWVYEIADFNVSVTNQPISEISALAIALFLFQDGKFLDRNFEEKKFKNGKVKIIPSEKGKIVIKD